MSTSWHYLVLVVPCLVACGGGGDPATPTASEWSGHTYALNIGERSWTDPRGVINDVKDYVPEFVFEVQGDSTTSFKALTATADMDVQRPCNATKLLPGAGNAIGPADYPLRIKHLREDIVVNAVLHDVSFVDALPTGGVVSTTGKFSATLDGRDVAPLFTQIDANPTPDELCSTLAQLSPPVDCQACPHDGAKYCLTLKAEKIGFTESTVALKTIDTPTDSSCN
jgi:hypothetical protein